MNYPTSFQQHNRASIEAMQQRLHNAYEDWLITKSHIKDTALKHHTDPGKLTKYILKQGHQLTTFNDTLFAVIDTEEKSILVRFFIC